MNVTSTWYFSAASYATAPTKQQLSGSNRAARWRISYRRGLGRLSHPQRHTLGPGPRADPQAPAVLQTRATSALGQTGKPV